jgi:hypothetical protein
MLLSLLEKQINPKNQENHFKILLFFQILTNKRKISKPKLKNNKITKIRKIVQPYNKVPKKEELSIMRHLYLLKN